VVRHPTETDRNRAKLGGIAHGRRWVINPPAWVIPSALARGAPGSVRMAQQMAKVRRPPNGTGSAKRETAALVV